MKRQKSSDSVETPDREDTRQTKRASKPELHGHGDKFQFYEPGSTNQCALCRKLIQCGYMCEVLVLSKKEPDHSKNLCTECGVDMGPHNPRQLCGKTHCKKLKLAPEICVCELCYEDL